MGRRITVCGSWGAGTVGEGRRGPDVICAVMRDALTNAAPSPGSEAASTAGDRLYALVVRRGASVPAPDAVRPVLGIDGCPSDVAVRLIRAVAEGDARLEWDPDGAVRMREAPMGAVPAIGEVPICVVDLETTGGSPGASRITEIGAVRLEGLVVVDRFSMLVDPGRPIPAHITGITGIDDELVRGAPPIDVALPAFMAFAGHDVLVAHNAPFDLRFLNYERRRLIGDYFQNAWLDTLVLARRLLGTRVERHDLATLAHWAGAPVTPCHRALADAEATASVLARLVGLLGDGARTPLDRVVTVGQPGGQRLAHKVALAEDLPSAIGVYVMRDEHGRALRVGSAGNIRRRVRGYFTSGKRQGRLLSRAIESVDRVDHEVTGSEFEADLRAHRLVADLAPTCNRPAAGATSRRYLRLSGSGDEVRISAVARASRAGEHFGPLAAERSARLASEALQALLPAAAGCGVSPADACRRVLGDDPIAAAEEMALLIDRAARAGVLDGGAHAEQIDALVGVVSELAALARARGVRCVLVEPGAEAQSVVAFVVRDGLVAARVEVHTGGEAGAAHRILAALGAPRPGAPLPPASLEEIVLVRRRMDQRSGHPALITAPAGAAALMDALRRARGALTAGGTDGARGIVAAA